MKQKIYFSESGCWPLMGATPSIRTSLRKAVCTVAKQTIKTATGCPTKVLAGLSAWWRSECVSMTALCATDGGEVFTHGDVVKAHVFLAVLALLMALVG